MMSLPSVGATEAAAAHVSASPWAVILSFLPKENLLIARPKHVPSSCLHGRPRFPFRDSSLTPSCVAVAELRDGLGANPGAPAAWQVHTGLGASSRQAWALGRAGRRPSAFVLTDSGKSAWPFHLASLATGQLGTGP